MDLSRHIKWIKIPVFLLCLGPVANLVWLGFHDGLGANPLEFITHSTGFWTLTFLCITLSVTPLRKVLHLNWLVRFRRMMGLFAFFYGCLHLMTWIWFDKNFDVSLMLDDLQKRRFIIAGMTGLALMLPLALTSTQGMIRRLGGRRWQQLHRLVYLSAMAGVIHYYWLVKSDVRKPLFYGLLVAILLAWRLGDWLIRGRGKTTAAPAQRKEPVTAETA